MRKHTARRVSRRTARLFLLLTTCGEAYCLYRLGATSDYVSAYLIVSTWVKDTVHRIVSKVGASLAGGAFAFQNRFSLALTSPPDATATSSFAASLCR
jgi:hypothetical protein